MGINAIILSLMRGALRVLCIGAPDHRLEVASEIGASDSLNFEKHDEQQRLEILMTLGQSLVGALFLINMKLAWWEAATLFSLWAVQFALSAVAPGPGIIGTLAKHIHRHVTIAYLAWAAVEIVRMILGKRKPLAFQLFRVMWRKHVR